MPHVVAGPHFEVIVSVLAIYCYITHHPKFNGYSQFIMTSYNSVG